MGCKYLSHSLCYLFTFLIVSTGVQILDFNEVLFIFFSIIFQPHCVDYSNFVVGFYIGNCETSAFVPFRDCLALGDPLLLHMNFEISVSISVKKAFGTLRGVVLNLFIILGNIAILISSLSVDENGMSFNLCRLSLIIVVL